jgi:hypothetical protein
MHILTLMLLQVMSSPSVANASKCMWSVVCVGRVGDEVKGAPVSRNDPNYDPDDEGAAGDDEDVHHLISILAMSSRHH